MDYYSAIKKSRLLKYTTAWDRSQGHYTVWGEKKADLKRSHTIELHLYNSLKMTKLQ